MGHHGLVRLLVLGGTWFVGRHVVAEAVRRGWDVTTFSRGLTGSLPDGAAAIVGDRERRQDLERLAAGREWDAVVDVSGSVPRLVRDSAAILSGVTGRYAFVSTISAYRDWPHENVTEDSPLWKGDPDEDPGVRDWDPDAYGPLKVGCELAVASAFDDASRLILRPHVVLGPYEYVGRLAWWLTRMRRGGVVLAPAPDRAIQPIDGRDFATFALDLVERGTSGTYNVAGLPGQTTYGDLLRACADVVADAAEQPARLEWVDEDWLVERGVVQWTELPLWRNAKAPWGMDVRKAVAAGLSCRPIRTTVADTWAWLHEGGRPVPHERFAEHGMDPAKEAELLRDWRSLSTKASS